MHLKKFITPTSLGVSWLDCSSDPFELIASDPFELIADEHDNAQVSCFIINACGHHKYPANIAKIIFKGHLNIGQCNFLCVASVGETIPVTSKAVTVSAETIVGALKVPLLLGTHGRQVCCQPHNSVF